MKEWSCLLIVTCLLWRMGSGDLSSSFSTCHYLCERHSAGTCQQDGSCLCWWGWTGNNGYYINGGPHYNRITADYCTLKCHYTHALRNKTCAHLKCQITSNDWATQCYKHGERVHPSDWQQSKIGPRDWWKTDGNEKKEIKQPDWWKKDNEKIEAGGDNTNDDRIEITDWLNSHHVSTESNTNRRGLSQNTNTWRKRYPVRNWNDQNRRDRMRPVYRRTSRRHTKRRGTRRGRRRYDEESSSRDLERIKTPSIRFDSIRIGKQREKPKQNTIKPSYVSGNFMQSRDGGLAAYTERTPSLLRETRTVLYCSYSTPVLSLVFDDHASTRIKADTNQPVETTEFVFDPDTMKKMKEFYKTVTRSSSRGSSAHGKDSIRATPAHPHVQLKSKLQETKEGSQPEKVRGLQGEGDSGKEGRKRKGGGESTGEGSARGGEERGRETASERERERGEAHGREREGETRREGGSEERGGEGEERERGGEGRGGGERPAEGTSAKERIGKDGKLIID